MRPSFFVSDLHGRVDRYRKLCARIAADRPRAVFLGGDLLPMSWDQEWTKEVAGEDFAADFLVPVFRQLAGALGSDYPRVFLILGNDDPRSCEPLFIEASRDGLWDYLQDRRAEFDGIPVYGYTYVPPTPFHGKDWERYDVSRFVDPGCVSPEDGRRSVPVPDHEIRHATIREDLDRLTGDEDLEEAILLLHSPPYQTKLDRAALDGRVIDHVPVDVHIGSIAIRRFIEARQPRLCLHGHVHESARLTGAWRDCLGRTLLFTAAHDGPELALVRFDAHRPESASRELL
ncbi:MAG: metallophosphoesterase [Candidatus Eisenbacteria bacterium]